MSYHAEFKKQMMELQNHLKFNSQSQWNWYSQDGNDQFEIHVLADAALASHISNFLNQNPNTGFFDLDAQIVKDNRFRTSPYFFACFIYDKAWDDVSVYSRIPSIISDGSYSAPVVTAVLDKALKVVSKHQSYPTPPVPTLKQAVAQGYIAPPVIPPFVPAPKPPSQMSAPPMFGGMPSEAIPCDGRTVEFKVKIKTETACDCGAHSCGYKDSDDFAHSSWCKTQDKIWKVPF